MLAFENNITQKMEQNQPKIQQNTNQENEPEEWLKLRLQYSNQEQSLDEVGSTINLIEKWIWIKHQFQFQSFEERINEIKEASFDLKRIIKRAIELNKKQDWKILQKYSMKEVQALIQKVRTILKDMIEKGDVGLQQIEVVDGQKQHKDRQEIKVGDEQQPDAQKEPEQAQRQPNVQGEPEQPQSPYKQQKEASSSQRKYSSNKMNINQNYSNYSSVFPQIRPKGKLYHPQELASSFVLAKQIKQDYQIRSPYMFKSQKPAIRQMSADGGIFNSKYLKMTFKYLSKQQYYCGGLFEDFAKEADKMNMNKWMVFCKQFQFIEKFHKKDLIQVYQTATKFSSSMTLDQFLIAVSLLKQKYVQKFHEGDDFIHQVLQLSSEAAYKSKMSNLKVSYNGPKRNSFQDVNYKESQRLQLKQKQKEFKRKKHQRQLVLIKGMYPQHLLDEINQLKIKRQTKTTKLEYSLTKMEQTDRYNSKFNMKTKTNQFKEMNYSKIFHYNKQKQKQNSQYNTSKNTSFNVDKVNNLKNQFLEKQILGKGKDDGLKKNMGMNRTQFEKEIKTERQNTAKPFIQPRTFSNVSTYKPAVNPEQNPVPIQNGTWLTNVRTDTQQSDQILKEHLQIQKRIKKRNTKLMNLMQEMKDNSKKVEQINDNIQKQNQQEEEDNRDMIETQINFKAVK